MYESRHFRSIARRALRGFWGLTIAVTLVASLLGSTVSFSTGRSGFRVNVKLPENSDYFTPDEYDMLDEYAASDGYVIPVEPIFPSVLPRAVQRVLTALSNFLASDAGITVAILLGVIGVIIVVIGGGIQLGLIRYNLDLLTRENPPAFLTLFSRMSIFGRALGLRLMTGILTGLWSLLFVIPGIVATYRYALAPYLMAEHPEMGVMEAISQSKALMRGNKWRLFCLKLSFIGWGILSTLTLGIGDLWLVPYLNAAKAAFYLELTGRRDAMPWPDIPVDARPDAQPEALPEAPTEEN